MLQMCSTEPADAPPALKSAKMSKNRRHDWQPVVSTQAEFTDSSKEIFVLMGGFLGYVEAIDTLSFNSGCVASSVY